MTMGKGGLSKGNWKIIKQAILKKTLKYKECMAISFQI